MSKADVKIFLPMNKEKRNRKEYSKRYYLKNKEKCREIQKTYYEKNKEKCREASKKYYRENREKISGYRRKRRSDDEDWKKDFIIFKK